MNLRIMYLRDSYTVGQNGDINAGQPVGCLAIKLNKDNDTLEYQMSVLNPEDKFSRKVARQVAIGRMTKPIVLSIAKDSTMHEISEQIMLDVAQNSKAPSRARKAARLWLKQNWYLPLYDE